MFPAQSLHVVDLLMKSSSSYSEINPFTIKASLWVPGGSFYCEAAEDEPELLVSQKIMKLGNRPFEVTYTR